MLNQVLLENLIKMEDINQLNLPQTLLNKLNTLENRENIIQKLKWTLLQLEERHGIQLITILTGGSSGLVGKAKNKEHQEFIIKIPLQKIDLGVEFENELKALKYADGKGYVRLLGYEETLNVAYLESLGQPLAELGFTPQEQLKIICETLQLSWVKVAETDAFPNTLEIIHWFRSYLTETWEQLDKPCTQSLLEKTHQFLQERNTAYDPNKCVLVHGDAHNLNVLQANLPDKTTFKLIDPDGIVSEPAYDLGVLMREWIEELAIDPVSKGLERLDFLSKETGVDKKAIWQWGLIQCVATGLVLLENNSLEEGKMMLEVAESWKSIK